MTKLKNILALLRGRFNTQLPIGVTEFNAFCDKVFSTYGIPSLPSYKHAIASMIQHLGPQVDRAPLIFFSISIHKAQANQVAFEVMQQINKDEKAKNAASNEPVQDTTVQATA